MKENNEAREKEKVERGKDNAQMRERERDEGHLLAGLLVG